MTELPENVEVILGELDDVANLMEKSEANLKKCPKARLTRGYLESKIQCLDETWNTFRNAHHKLLRAVKREQRQKIAYFTEYHYLQNEEKYLDMKANLKDKLMALTPAPSAAADKDSGDSRNTCEAAYAAQVPQVRLPSIHLPTFSGGYEQWPMFQDLFTALVHENSTLSSVQKLHYLKTSVTGEAELLLKHVQITDSNYTYAWDILKNRYSNKRLIVNSLLKRIVNQKKMFQQSANQLKSLLDTTVECLHCLNNLGIKTDFWDPLIIFLVVQKMDSESHKEWEEYISKDESNDLPDLTSFKKFLEIRFRTLELTSTVTQTRDRTVKERCYHITAVDKSCSFCKQDHVICHCKEFCKLGITQRSEFAKNNNLCFNCLVPGHAVNKCRSSSSCKICHKRHHSLLHQQKGYQDTSDNMSQNLQPKVSLHSNVEENDDVIVNTAMASHIMSRAETALLATAIVTVKSESGHTTVLRALVDPGSQACFITERAAQTLKCKRYYSKGNVIGVGSIREPINHVVSIKVQSRCEVEFSLRTRAYIMSKQLTTQIPTTTIIPLEHWTHLEGLILADSMYHTPGSIDLLLGVNEYVQILCNELIKGPPGSPCAQKTHLGWILFGNICNTNQENSLVVMHHQVEMDNLLKNLWEIDTHANTKRNLTKEEQLCEDIYRHTHRRDNTGRYIVKLPFKTNQPKSPEGHTRDVAMRRLLQLERRFDRSPTLKKAYTEVIEEYIAMGHLEEVPKEEKFNRSVYLPHHAVIRADKETTKTRVVFDASSKGSNGISLNDELLSGPVLQEDLRSIIMRWRMHKICFVSDVEKMYRMVRLNKEDTEYHRILWRPIKKPDLVEQNLETEEGDIKEEEIKDYRLMTVTFGTASAPYLAVKTMMQLADDEENEDNKEGIRRIREDFYVDDLMSGTDTVEQSIAVCKQIKKILLKGGFSLQKWSSNDTEFLKSLSVKEISSKAIIDMKLEGMIKTLGVSWNLGKDEFQYRLELQPIHEITKRTVLSDIQKLYDPLGWIAPAIIQAKILVQKLWLTRVSWDETINDELQTEWKNIRLDLTRVNLIRLQRWMNTLSSEKYKVTLHGFCDASIQAYGAVLYCRVDTPTGVKTQIVAARTKVAPVKTISLPRLELCGATLLAKLLSHVGRSMRIPSEQIYAWTDSSVVLSWLIGEPNKWKTFVANRVVEILEVIDNSQWYHVKSKHNPADVASRGSTVLELKDNKLWWNGPEWLIQEEIEYSRPDYLPTDLERKKDVFTYLNITDETKNTRRLNFEDYDTLQELLRVIVYARRFLNIKRKPNEVDGNLKTKELEEALEICIKLVQEEEFYDEIERLKEKKAVKMKSSLRSLNPYLDEKNILRVGGRLRHSNLEHNTKHPIIIGKRNSLTMLLIADAHSRTLHGGVQMMLSYLFTKYWIVGCKALVKRYIFRCLTCARQVTKNRQQLMGDLPEMRVTPARPFLHSGVDFAGPVFVSSSRRRGATVNKAYICIFICLAVKAIHLELVSDLTTDAFIAAFKRFVARRGRCSDIWSDNGTNFLGASKELVAMWKESSLNMPNEAATTLASDGTQWHFIPPYSPNFGGLWEAGVKSVKHHLRRILTRNLTFEEMTTVLTQIEACLNSRPLIPLDTADPDCIEALTPGHFLVGEALLTVPDRDLTSINIDRLSRWQYTQRLVQDFWKRWRSEYLSRLNERPKWLKRSAEFQIGDIVLIKDKNLPPSKWVLGRIVNKHPGHDNITRVYSIRCGGSVIQRSVSMLCPLPIVNNNNV